MVEEEFITLLRNVNMDIELTLRSVDKVFIFLELYIFYLFSGFISVSKPQVWTNIYILQCHVSKCVCQPFEVWLWLLLENIVCLHGTD